MKELIARRFWAFVQKSENGCWEWTGALSKDFGYGMFRFSKEKPTMKAHRASWVLNNGEIPDGVNVLHKCDNPKCVRPDHLFLGSILDNNQDMTRKGRHGRMLFTHEKIVRLRELHKRHYDVLSHQRIADWFGVSKSTISHILNGRNWKETGGSITDVSKKRRYNTKLDRAKVEEIRIRRFDGEKLKPLALEYGVCESRISKICRGEIWT